jgi:hypothetical protein
MASVSIASEGLADVPVLRRILAHLGHDVTFVYGGRGKGSIDRNLKGYNNAARFAPWLVVRDLDHDAPCASALAAQLIPHPSEHMRLRIAVREVESWLLGDPEALADFLSVRRDLFPADPETLNDPKQTLVNLARKSRRREIREDMVPANGTSATVGPAYSFRIEEFARHHWRPAMAAAHCRSLRRTLARLASSWEGMP